MSVNAVLPRPAFSACGIELEYMIVDRESFDVRALVDRVLLDADGRPVNDVARGSFGWSNELAAHVLEIKNEDPGLPLPLLVEGFAVETAEVNRRLRDLGARLMPGAIHPWMDPRRETHLWPHEYAEIYQAYDRIFDCRRHGWANLQSMHVNLPFAGEDEFVRLHAALRLLLPILPALAASSPVADGRITPFLDYRMDCYRRNAERMPSMTGDVIPEPVGSEAEYRRLILAPLHRDIAPLDPDGVMDGEWLNARGAIARFDRNAIEIRVIDTQERPRADIAIAAATFAVARACFEQRLGAGEPDDPLPTGRLSAILDACSHDGEAAVIDDQHYLARLGVRGRCTARELWGQLLEITLFAEPGGRSLWGGPLGLILERGTLARRILDALRGDTRHARLQAVCRRLCECLERDEAFTGVD